MTMRTIVLGFAALLLACESAPPSPPPPSAPTAHPSALPAPSASPAAAASTAPPAATGAPRPATTAATDAGAENPDAVTPKVTMKRVYTGEQEHEGWPEYEYEGMPALSTDGAKIAVYEERDGWGHTRTPGVRILDLTGKTVVWFPLVPTAAGAPANEANAKKAEPTFQGYVTRANAELAKSTWVRLVAPRPTTKPGTTPFLVTLEAGDVVLRMTFPNEDAYKGLEVPQSMSARNTRTHSLVEVDTSAWTPKQPCATPSFRVVGMTPKVAVFHQQLGKTSHACDGVPIAHEWRVVKL